MNNSLDLHGATVLVTGATGFIGGRLVEYLVGHYRSTVRALVRNYGRAVYLSRLPVQLLHGDLMSPDSLQKACAGCDMVFHCAAGMTGEDDERYKATVDGTRNIIEAALAANVARFVHVSSNAVYGPKPGAIVDEDTPLVYSKDLYSDAKIDAERLAFEYAKSRHLPLVVLRPTVVYGPRSGSWTLGPLDNIRQGRLVLIDEGAGIANHVYVDDVVQALLLAATCPEAVGEAFIVSYGSGVTWKEFFGYYARMLGVQLPSMSVQMIEQQRRRMEQLSNPINMGLSFVASPHARAIVGEIPGVGAALHLATRVIPKRGRQAILDRAEAMRLAKLNPPRLPRRWSVDLYSAKAIYKIDKASRVLGYRPQFSLDEGMRLTEAWLRHTHLI